MADFKVSGMDLTMDQMRRFSKAPDSVKSEILVTMANISAAEQRKTAMEMGVYDADSDGKHLVDKIKVNKPTLTDDGGSISVTFSGRRTDKSHKKPTRNAEIAFVNEYGKRGQAARPFVKTANKRAEGKAQKAAEAVWDKWINK